MAGQGSLDGLILEHFEDDGVFPNSRLPLLLYRAAVAPDAASPEAMEALFAEGGWPPAWRSSIFTYHHYHSTAHEALGIASGTAHLMLGGPRGREFDVAAGDVIVIPAGGRSGEDHLHRVAEQHRPSLGWVAKRSISDPNQQPQLSRFAPPGDVDAGEISRFAMFPAARSNLGKCARLDVVP